MVTIFESHDLPNLALDLSITCIVQCMGMVVDGEGKLGFVALDVADQADPRACNTGKC